MMTIQISQVDRLLNRKVIQGLRRLYTDLELTCKAEIQRVSGHRPTSETTRLNSNLRQQRIISVYGETSKRTEINAKLERHAVERIPPPRPNKQYTFNSVNQGYPTSYITAAV